MPVSLKSFQKQNTYTRSKVICWKKEAHSCQNHLLKKKEAQVLTMSNSLMRISFKINQA